MIRGGLEMAGKSLLAAERGAKSGVAEPRGNRGDRGEADRARAVLLTLAGWTSPRIAEAFGVREDTVRLWRSDFVRGGVEGLKANVAPGPAPVKSEAALRVVTPLLEQPVADRRNWTIPRLQVEIEAREGVRISRSQLSKALRKRFRLAPAPRHTLKARQVAAEVERAGLRLQLRAQQAEAGDIVLLYGDESEALTHPYLASRGRTPRVPGAGPGQEGRDAGFHLITSQADSSCIPVRRSAAAATLSPISSNWIAFMVPGPANPSSRWRWSRMNGPIHTSKPSRAALRLPARTGSPSSGCPSMRRN